MPIFAIAFRLGYEFNDNYKILLMKVLQTVKYYTPSNGGMESVVKNIVEGIAEFDENVKFTVYSNHHYSNFNRHSHIINNVEVIKETTPFIYKSQPLNLFYSGLKDLLRSTDIIHHHYPFPNLEFQLLKYRSLVKRRKLIITWHANVQNSRWSWISKAYSPLIVEVLKNASNIVVTSPQLFDNSEILQNFKSKVEIIPLSFDPSFESYEVESRKFPVGRRFRILFVGKLRKYKGVDVLIKAVRDLPVELIIVGDGEEEQSLQELGADLVLNKRLIFYKHINNFELKRVYKDSDLFVLPSINEAEAFGIVQLEAMASSLPVINTDLSSGVPYVSIDNITGYTVKPKSVEELRQAISRLMNDPVLYEQYSIGSLERSKLFTRSQMSSEYYNLYKK